jgi:hypothetical protein
MQCLRSSGITLNKREGVNNGSGRVAAESGYNDDVKLKLGGDALERM